LLSHQPLTEEARNQKELTHSLIFQGHFL